MIDYGNVNGTIAEVWQLVRDLRALVNEERERRKNPYYPWWTPPSTGPDHPVQPDITWRTTDHT